VVCVVCVWWCVCVVCDGGYVVWVLCVSKSAPK
jgi:hypothetical protein